MTATALLVQWVAGLIPLPFLAHDRVEEALSLAGRTGDSGLFRVTTLGVTPILSAFIVVEIAALLVPRWRALRLGDSASRARLTRATWVLSAVFAFIQALGIAKFMAHNDWVAPADRSGVLAVTFAAAGAALLFIPLANLVTHKGLGNGFSVLFAGSLLPTVFTRVKELLWMGELDGSGPTVPVFVLGMFALAAGVLAVVRRFAHRGSAFPGVVGEVAGTLVMAAVALGIFTGLDSLFALPLAELLLALTYVGAILVDLTTEWRFRSEHPDAVSVWPLHRPQDWAAIRDRVGGAVHARSLTHRTLLQFFGPWVPIEILVPKERAAEAIGSVRAASHPSAALVPGR